MIRSIRELIHVRWRAAQVLAAVADGKNEQAWALRAAVQIEGLDTADVRDEMGLLIRQFGHRPTIIVREEASRLWRTLTMCCTRCDRFDRCLDNAGICYRCILE